MPFEKMRADAIKKAQESMPKPKVTVVNEDKKKSDEAKRNAKYYDDMVSAIKKRWSK